MASSLVDITRFYPASSGTGSFVVASAVQGYETPGGAGALNSAQYSYRAESADLTQWEVGYGIYTSGSTTLTRATVLFNSLGTTVAVNFTTVPQVAIVALAEDLQTKLGIATNTAAAAGNIGEVMVSSGTTGGLTSSTGVAAASLSLTAGDWDISATAIFNTSGGTTVTDWFASVSTTSSSLGLPYAGSLVVHERVPAEADHTQTLSILPTQALLSGTTTFYLNVSGVFTGTAPSVTYVIRARRMR